MKLAVGGMKQLYPRDPEFKSKVLYRIDKVCILEPDWLDESDTFVKEYNYLRLYTDLRNSLHGVLGWI